MNDDILPENYSPQTAALYGAYDLAVDRPDVDVLVRRVGRDYETKLRCGKRWSARYVRSEIVNEANPADGALRYMAEAHYHTFLDTLDRGEKRASMVDGAGATVTMYDSEGC